MANTDAPQGLCQTALSVLALTFVSVARSAGTDHVKRALAIHQSGKRLIMIMVKTQKDLRVHFLRGTNVDRLRYTCWGSTLYHKRAIRVTAETGYVIGKQGNPNGNFLHMITRIEADLPSGDIVEKLGTGQPTRVRSRLGCRRSSRETDRRSSA